MMSRLCQNNITVFRIRFWCGHVPSGFWASRHRFVAAFFISATRGSLNNSWKTLWSICVIFTNASCGMCPWRLVSNFSEIVCVPWARTVALHCFQSSESLVEIFSFVAEGRKPISLGHYSLVDHNHCRLVLWYGMDLSHTLAWYIVVEIRAPLADVQYTVPSGSRVYPGVWSGSIDAVVEVKQDIVLVHGFQRDSK